LNWVDIVIIVYLVISLVSGIAQGLIRSVLSLVGLILGIVLASNFYQQLGGVFSFISNRNIADIIAFILILVAVMVIAGIIGNVLRSILKALMLGWIDRIGGAVFGVFMGALSASALLAVIVKLTGSKLIADSALAGFFLDKFPMILGFLPSEFDVIRNFFK
jgi:membrane protein required for colicin V production